MLYVLAFLASLPNAYVWVMWSRAVNAGRALEAAFWDAGIVLLSSGAIVSLWQWSGNDTVVFLLSALGGGCGTWASLTLVKKRTVPFIEQTGNYNCGPAALQSWLSYHGVDMPQSRLEGMAGCTTDHGTEPEGLVKAAVLCGFDIHAKCDWDLKELATRLPAIVCIQAQGTPEQYARDESGHYVVLTAVERGWCIYMDPSEGEDRLPVHEFVKRWHDLEDYGPIVRWGMTVAKQRK